MTRQFKKLAHSLYECKYHIVFCPKYRYKIMQDEVAKYVTQQIYRLSSQKDGVEVVEVNVQPEHVHLVVSIPPKYAVSQYMGFLKGKMKSVSKSMLNGSVAKMKMLMRAKVNCLTR